MRTYILVALCLSLLLASCKKDYQANINSTVTGRFYDSTNRVPIPGVNVKVGEYQSKSSIEVGTMYELKDYVGSATTDANGEYHINFSTTGKGNYYFLVWSNVPPGVTITDNAGRLLSMAPINGIGGENTLNIYGFKQYYMQVRMIVINNPLPYLNITVLDAREDAGGGDIYGKNNDTVLNMAIKKNENFSLLLNTYDAGLNKAYLGTPIPFSPITAPGDTVQGGTYTIYPATFK